MTPSYDVKATEAIVDRSYVAEVSGYFTESLDELNDLIEEYDLISDQNESLTPHLRATLLLRFGVLCGWSESSLLNGQEKSKNLLTTANRIFKKLGLIKEQAICANYLSLAYYRRNELSEASLFLESAKSLYHKGEVRLRSISTESLINYGLKNFEGGYKKLMTAEELFLDSGSDYYEALYHGHVAVYRRRLSLPEVEPEYKKALILYENLGNQLHQSIIKNNLAGYYISEKLFEKAEICALSALQHAIETENPRAIGNIQDTLAGLFFKLGDYETSLKYSTESIIAFEKTEAFNLLINSYVMKIKTLFQLNKVPEALAAYARACESSSKGISPSSSISQHSSIL